jgi:hypothetical protein
MPPFLDTEPANNVEQSEGGKRDRQDVPVHVRDHRLLTIAMERGQTPRGDPVRETRPESEPSAPAAWRDAGGGAVAPLPGYVGIPLAPKSRALAGDAGLFFCIECRIKSSTRAIPTAVTSAYPSHIQFNSGSASTVRSLEMTRAFTGPS